MNADKEKAPTWDALEGLARRGRTGPEIHQHAKGASVPRRMKEFFEVCALLQTISAFNPDSPVGAITGRGPRPGSSRGSGAAFSFRFPESFGALRALRQST